MVNPCDAKPLADKILEDFDDACNALGITHFLVWGTCLGFYRDHGYIADDNDIDVGVACNDEDFGVLVERLREVGFAVDPENRQHFHRDNIILEIWKVGRLWEITLFVRSFDTITYNNRAYKVPHPIEEYLARMYGEDWRIPKSRC